MCIRDRLYAAYPDFADIEVVTTRQTEFSSFSPAVNMISLSAPLSDSIEQYSSGGGAFETLKKRIADLEAQDVERIGREGYHWSLESLPPEDRYPSVQAAIDGQREFRDRELVKLRAQLVEKRPPGMEVSIKAVTSTIIHEIAHKIQSVEGFANGGSPKAMPDRRKKREQLIDAIAIKGLVNARGDMDSALTAFHQRFDREPQQGAVALADNAAISATELRAQADRLPTRSPYERYQALAGEVEARNVQTRQAMSGEQRLAQSPLQTQDVAPADIIVMVDGQEVAASELANATPEAAPDLPMGRFPDTGIRLSFAGESAVSANKLTLANAQRSIEAGIDPEVVRQQTGWFQGVDERWRFEIDDSSALLRATLATLEQGARGETAIHAFDYRVTPDGRYHLTLRPDDATETTDFIKLVDISRGLLTDMLPKEVVASIDAGEGVDEWEGEMPEMGLTVHKAFTFDGVAGIALDEVLQHPLLFAAYPDLRDVIVQVDPRLGGGANFGASKDGRADGFAITLGRYQQMTSLLHELAHAVQALEGFAPGGGSRDKSLPTNTQIEHDTAEPFNRQIKAIRVSSAYREWIAKCEQEAGLKVSPRTGTMVQAQAGEIRLEANDRFGITALEGQRKEALLALREEGGDAWFLSDRQIAYQRLAGEVEARNVQRRQWMDEVARRAISPLATQDTPFDKMIVKDAGMVSAASAPSSEQLYDSPAFKGWFRDSRVVDDQGMPKVVYKGMYPYDWRTESEDGQYSDEITTIDRGEPLPAFNGEEPGVDVAGFFGDQDIANRFATVVSPRGAVFPAYLSLQKPYEIDAVGEKAGNIQFGPSGLAFREAMRSGQYDGAIIYNTADEGTVYVTTRPEQVKSTFNIGTFDPDEPDMRLSFAGASARSANRMSLDYAQRALAAGINEELIREQTGWHCGADAGWRFEIRDDQARVNYGPDSSSNPEHYMDWIEEAQSRERGVPLGQVLQHAELFQAYPLLSTYRLMVVDDQRDLNGATANINLESKTITLVDPYGLRIREDQVDPTLPPLLHELSHAVAAIEGFAQGGSIKTIRDEVGHLPNRAVVENAQLLQEYASVYGGVDEVVKRAPCPDFDVWQDASIHLAKNPDRLASAEQQLQAYDDAPTTYRHLAGEVEARNVEARIKLSTEERQRTPPLSTEDTPRDQQMIRFSDGSRLAVETPAALPALSRVCSDRGQVINETRAGELLQDGASDMLDVLAGEGPVYGWMDGGCRLFAEALGEWSKGRIGFAVTSRDGQHASHAVGVLALGDEPNSTSVILDADGVSTPKELLEKLAILELSKGEQLVALDERAKVMAKALPQDDKLNHRLVTLLNMTMGPFEQWEKSLQEELAQRNPGLAAPDPLPTQSVPSAASSGVNRALHHVRVTR